MSGWPAILQNRIPGALEYLGAGGWVILPLGVLCLWLWVLIFHKLFQIWGLRPGEDKPRPRGWRAGLQAQAQAAGAAPPEARQARLEEARLRLEARLDSRVQTILVLASVAPLLGLLGTVTGMITTFEVISRFGTGNAKALAGGISEALITTQLGLLVALPGLFLGHFIGRRVERMKARMESFCLALARTGEEQG